MMKAKHRPKMVFSSVFYFSAAFMLLCQPTFGSESAKISTEKTLDKSSENYQTPNEPVDCKKDPVPQKSLPQFLPIIGRKDDYYLNDEASEVLRKLEHSLHCDKKQSWCGVFCNSERCELKPSNPKISRKGDSFDLVVSDSKGSDSYLIAYLNLPEVRCSGNRKQYFSSHSPKSFGRRFIVSNDSGDSYISNSEGNYTTTVTAKDLPKPFVAGSMTVSAKLANKNFIEIVLTSEGKTQVLTTLTGCTFGVLWAGDLNQDGNPSLIYYDACNYGEGVGGQVGLKVPLIGKKGEFKSSSFRYYSGG